MGSSILNPVYKSSESGSEEAAPALVDSRSVQLLLDSLCARKLLAVPESSSNSGHSAISAAVPYG